LAIITLLTLQPRRKHSNAFFCFKLYTDVFFLSTHCYAYCHRLPYPNETKNIKEKRRLSKTWQFHRFLFIGLLLGNQYRNQYQYQIFFISHFTSNKHSANVVKSCTKACRRVVTSILLYLMESESSCDLGSETYKLNLKNYIYNYNNYILNLAGRSIGKLL
jgi:hypothetical protein